ncbi:MAG: PAS domain-containing protein [Methylococcaceae bacterium]|nr:PAS domain-containing protein [Methylococcaceae bacterium]
MNKPIFSNTYKNDSDYYQELLAATNVGVWEYDHVADAHNWNPQVFDILGRSVGDYPNNLADFFGLIHPHDESRVKARLEAVLKIPNFKYDVQFRYKHHDGHWVWIEIRGRVIERLPDGSPLRSAGIATKSTNPSIQLRLNENEQPLRLLTETISEVFWISDRFFREMFYVSPAYERIWQQPVEELYTNPKIYTESVHPDDLGAVLKELGKQTQGLPFDHEYRIVRPDGSIRWIWDRGYPVVESDGQINRFVGLAQDITERTLAKLEISRLNEQLGERVIQSSRELEATADKLRLSEERLQFALEASNIGIWDWMIPTGDIYYTLPMGTSPKYVPIDPPQVAMSLWKELIHPDEREEILAASEHNLSKKDKYELEFRLRQPDGSYRWVLARGKVMDRDSKGAAVRAIGTYTDIHDRKEIELQNRKLAAIVEASSDMVTIYSPDLTLEYINEAFRNTLGFAAAEPLETIHILDYHPDCAYQRFIEEGIPTAIAQGRWQGDNKFQARAGSLIQVSQLIVANKDQRTGKLEFLATICRDITERKQLEDDVRRHLLKLQESDRRKDEFLAILAHELRNPLAPLTIAGHMLKQDKLDEEQRGWCTDIIGRQLKHLTKLVDDLLDVSRISRGKITLNRQPLDVTSFVEQAVEISRPWIDAGQHELTLNLPSESLPVLGDPTRLAQVISNLLNNAAKFTAPGGHIALTVRHDGDQAFICVKDNGIGIKPDMLNHIFDLFVQAVQSPSKSSSGLGIGLSLAKQLIHLHGGSIEAYSEGKDKGSEFVVRLPLTHSSMEFESSRSQDPEAAPPARQRILVVDDNVDAASSLFLWLKSKGYDVRIAHAGLTGIELAEAFRPQLIILDIGMPGMDGYEVCRRLREQSWGRNQIIVAWSGWGQDVDKQKAIDAGFTQHLTKPVQPEELENLLGTLKEATV